MKTTGEHFGLKWIIACAAGELLGLAGAAVISMNIGIYDAPKDTVDIFIKLLGTVITGAFEGTCLAIFQWWLLRKKFSALPFKEWWGATALIAVIGWLLGMVYPLFFAGEESSSNGPVMPLGMVLLMALGMGLVLGAIFGGAQWIILQKYATGAKWWIWANAAGWMVAMAIIFAGATWPDENTPHELLWFSMALCGILAGVSVGFFTGQGLKFIQPAQQHDKI